MKSSVAMKGCKPRQHIRVHGSTGCRRLPHGPSDASVADARATRSASPYIPRHTAGLFLIVSLRRFFARPVAVAFFVRSHRAVKRLKPSFSWVSTIEGPVRSLAQRYRAHPFGDEQSETTERMHGRFMSWSASPGDRPKSQCARAQFIRINVISFAQAFASRSKSGLNENRNLDHAPSRWYL
jgi:hypothetical protein